ncbi:MAG: hypothetical protein EOP86_24395 [Verrucomicrobiaceae bacterium]|nr:MAG: hypothetical protein EOP86_24395 [Verrucomicrobiaceae bacterium]
MPHQQNSPTHDDQPDSYPQRLADLLDRNYAMMHRMRINQAVLEAEVLLLRDLLFEAIADPATAAKARTIYDERIQALRQDGMIQLENLFGPEIAARLDSQPEPRVDDGG